MKTHSQIKLYDRKIILNEVLCEQTGMARIAKFIQLDCLSHISFLWLFKGPIVIL